MSLRWYDPVAPGQGLGDVLACSWTAHPTGRHRLVPDACIDVVWLSSSGRLVLCGPDDHAWEFELPAGTTAVGVRFLPGRAAEVLAIDVSRCRNQRTEVAELADVDATLAPELARHGATPAGIAALERQVREWCRRRAPADGFSARVVDLLVTSPSATVAEVADAVGMTIRQLHRRSAAVFGYGVSTLGRILRFHRFVGTAERLGPPATIGRLAAEAGYSDHAHLARDCRAITGLTPTRFLAEHFPTFPDLADPYKTQEPLVAALPG